MNIALIVAGGSGTRTNQDVPKQFLCINNKPIIIYTLESFQNCPCIDEIIVSCIPGWESLVEAYSAQFSIKKLKKVVPAGENRQESIYNGYKEIAKYASKNDIIIQFDANRPIISKEIITDGIEKCLNTGVSIGVYPCYDSMLVMDETKKFVDSEFDRDLLLHGTGPQILTFNIFSSVLEKHKNSSKPMTLHEMCMLEHIPMSLFYTSAKCIKITTKDDIEILTALLTMERHSWLK